MKIFSFVPIIIVILFGTIFTDNSARAQDKPIELQGDFSFSTDYVFRGVSRSDGDIVAQGLLSVLFPKGFYTDFFVSSLSSGVFGRDFELEAAAGWGTTSGAYDLNFAVAYDSFHGNGGSDGYFEFRSSISRDIGFVYARAGLSYVPDNREFGLGRSIYSFMDAEIPIPLGDFPPVTIAFQAGYEDFEGGFDKWDWGASLYMDVLGFELGLRYHDNNQAIVTGSKSRFVFSIKRFF